MKIARGQRRRWASSSVGALGTWAGRQSEPITAISKPISRLLAIYFPASPAFPFINHQ